MHISYKGHGYEGHWNITTNFPISLIFNFIVILSVYKEHPGHVWKNKFCWVVDVPYKWAPLYNNGLTIVRLTMLLEVPCPESITTSIPTTTVPTITIVPQPQQCLTATNHPVVETGTQWSRSQRRRTSCYQPRICLRPAPWQKMVQVYWECR